MRNLTVEVRDGVYVVVDAEGGVWWPHEAASREIEAAADPEALALRICNETPMRGEWKS